MDPIGDANLNIWTRGEGRSDMGCARERRTASVPRSSVPPNPENAANAAVCWLLDHA